MKRLVLIVLYCALLLFGCTRTLQIDGYEVLGNVDLSAPAKYSFSNTLLNLYPQCQSIALAQPLSTDGKKVILRITDTLAGDVTSGTQIEALSPVSFTDLDSEYLVFLRSDGSTRLLIDNAGLLRINGDIIYPANGGSALLEQAKVDIAKFENNIFLPAKFNYYRELDELVAGSDYIFIGTVEEILPVRKESYYVRAEGLEQEITDISTPIRISASNILKGKFIGDINILLCESMFDSTIDVSNLMATTYTIADCPPLEQGGEYIFFVSVAPGGLTREYDFFVNPLQGYVPIFSDETLPIPTNAAFASSYYIDDLLWEIESVLSGDSVAVHYETFQIEDNIQ